jgi:hypothetical protein
MQGSASLTVITEPCEHLEAGAWPLRVELVLDDSMGFTDALVRCRVCDRAYLLEMLDADAGTRLMRVAPVDPEVAAGTLHDLGRGSCDLTRAGAQVHQLQTASVFSRVLLWIDPKVPVILARVPVPGDHPLPAAGWRLLPCDGSWIDYARSYTSTSNP